MHTKAPDPVAGTTADSEHVSAALFAGTSGNVAEEKLN